MLVLDKKSQIFVNPRCITGARVGKNNMTEPVSYQIDFWTNYDSHAHTWETGVHMQTAESAMTWINQLVKHW